MWRSALLPALAAALLLRAPARGAGPDDKAEAPEQVLKEAGLTRVDHSYVLDGEVQAGKLARGFDDVAARLSADLQRQAGLEMNLQRDQFMAGELRQEAAMDRQAASVLRRNRGAARGLNNQARNLANRAQAAQRRAGSTDRKQLNAANQAVSAEQKKLMQAQAEYRALVEKTMRRYAELSGRSDVVEALRTLNRGVHPKFALGPVGAYRERVDQAMLALLAEKGLRVGRRSVRLAEEADFLEEFKAADAIRRDLEKAPAPADDPRRADLARRAEALRGRAEALDRRLAELAADEQVLDALEELNRTHARRKFRPALSPEALHARKLLGSLAAAGRPPTPAPAPTPTPAPGDRAR